MKARNDFVAALLKEIVLQKEYPGNEIIETIYFGGGTPSLLTERELGSIMQRLSDTFDIAASAEITLEANPDDISGRKIKDWKQAGINRLSIGVQSFFEEDLQWMNRAHSADQALTSIRATQDGGLQHISIDLIYGNPTLPDGHWEKNVQQAIGLGIPHLSCYALTVESNTALRKMIVQKKKKDINQEDQSRQFLLLMEWMESAGYEQYEISNFALPGKRSRHNSSYWQGKKYLGLGPSAHSYNTVSRQWNVSNNSLYIQSLEKDELLFEKETLTQIQLLNEYIMTSLRTTEGVDLCAISNQFNPETGKLVEMKALPYIADLRLKKKGSTLCLTNQGKLFADGITAALFFEA